MATADLKLIYGGGGSFKPTFFSGVQAIASGSSGTLLIITAPAGKKVRLFSLFCPTGSAENNITLTAEGNAVVTAQTLQGAPTTTVNSFAVGQYYGGISGTSGAINGTSIPYVESINTIVVTKTSGSTANIIYYSYAYGD